MEMELFYQNNKYGKPEECERSLSEQIRAMHARAGVFSCLGVRRGSITIFRSVPDPPPPGFLENASCYWYLDKKLAARKHFPAINWTKSFSSFVPEDPELVDFSVKCKHILQKEEKLRQLVEINGRDSLSPQDQFTYLVATTIREDYLMQNHFTPYDRYCSEYKTKEMLRNLISYYDLGGKVVEKESQYSDFRSRTRTLHYNVCSQKFFDQDKIEQKLKEVAEEIEKTFKME